MYVVVVLKEVEEEVRESCWYKDKKDMGIQSW